MKEFHKFKIFKAIINLTTESDKGFKFKLIIYPDIENKNIAINNYNSHSLQFTITICKQYNSSDVLNQLFSR